MTNVATFPAPEAAAGLITTGQEYCGYKNTNSNALTIGTMAVVPDVPVRDVAEELATIIATARHTLQEIVEDKDGFKFFSIMYLLRVGEMMADAIVHSKPADDDTAAADAA
jgi:hypothetical protein